MSVSVVIPAYNAIDHIEDCLASVANQRTPFSLQVIVVDDGSTDGTLEKLRSTPGLTCLAQSNRGPAAARNAGIRRARGEFIAFLDADDLWPAGKLQKQVELLQATLTQRCALAIAVSLKASAGGRIPCSRKTATARGTGGSGPTCPMPMHACSATISSPPARSSHAAGCWRS